MLSDLVEKRIVTLTSIIHRLLDQPPVCYRDATPSSFPETRGVYVIKSHNGEVLRAGKTGQGSATLRQRLYSNHLMGNQNGNLRAQLVGSGQCRDMEHAKNWIRENCLVSFLELDDSSERANVEHFMLAVLKPRFCDDNKSLRGSQNGGTC
jgi:hypothetical protein